MMIQLASVFTLCTIAAATPAQDVEVARITGVNEQPAGQTVVERLSSDHAPTSPATGDIPQMPGWPQAMGSSANFSPTRGLVFDDLDADGALEIIASSTDGNLYAWHHDGSAVKGFPIDLIAMPQYAPSLADLDNDGDLEIVQTTRGLTDGGRLYAFDHEGNDLPGFPMNINGNNLTGSATLHDLDGDGDREIICAERDYPIGRIHIFDHDGTEWGGNWPYEMDHVPTCTAGVADVDNDGAVEIFTMSYDSMYLLEADGTVAPGWPQQISNANFSYQSPAFGDLDSDGDLEIALAAHQSAAGCYVYHHDGSLMTGWPQLVGTWTYCPPTITDLEGDGALEVICGRAGFVSSASDMFWAWDAGGNDKPGFPIVNPDGGGAEGPLTVADINGDGAVEIFADHNKTIDGLGFLFGVDSQGNDLPGFPLRPNGFTYLNSAMIADVDGDGDHELGVLSSHDNGVDVNLYDLPGQFAATSRDWPTYHKRNSRGGLHDPLSSVPAELLACEITLGSDPDENGCDVANLNEDDDIVEALRSQPGFFASEPNVAEIMITGDAQDAGATISAIATRDSGVLGIELFAKVKARNQKTNAIDDLGEYDVASGNVGSDTGHTINVGSADYLDGDGNFEVRVRYVSPAILVASGFETFLDQAQVLVE